ncbi:MAG: hypothetical protein Q8P11_04400 [bacterium]|nr:hypothetical protein [bacterium]
MKGWFVIVFSIIIVSLGLVFYYIFGLRYYIRNIIEINNLSEEIKPQSSKYFYTTDERTYRGTLAGVNTLGTDSVWVWGKQGLRRFVADSDTIYSFYRTCDERILNGLRGDGRISIDDRELYNDIQSWEMSVTQGMFVDVTTATQENGGVIGNLREIYAYDAPWPYMPIKLDELCKK